jgi:REP element-mobilizing transposase RayT
MARPLRIQYENAYYHVTCRGNARQIIFSSDTDRLAFLDLLGRSSDVYQTEILAYVLMSNHFHLLVKTPRGNLQEFMRHFNISYTGWYNRRHRRSGHLYQGRYHSFLIDADNYLKEVSRYIHLNPVKTKRMKALDAAARRKALGAYPWSSYPGYRYPGSRRSFLRTDEILAYFGGDTARGRRGYARFVEQGLSASLENPLELGKGHGIVGDADFVDAIRGRYLSRDSDTREIPTARTPAVRVEPERIIEAVCAETGASREALMQKGFRGFGRALLMELLYRYGGMKQREIGVLLGIDYSAVSIGRKRFLGMMEADPELTALFTGAQTRISQG